MKSLMKLFVLLGLFATVASDTGMDNKDIGKYELSAYCAVLAKEFPWARKLNSQARQASAERAWGAIARFYDNCKKGKAGKKGFPF